MNIQTTQYIGDDGKPMTPDQVELLRLTKAYSALNVSYTALGNEHAEFKNTLAAFEKRLLKLEADNLAAARKAGHDADGNLMAM